MVVDDETTEANALVPGAFRTVQWVQLPFGLPGSEFIETVKRLLAGNALNPAPAVKLAPEHSRPPVAANSPASIGKWIIPAVSMVIVGVVLWMNRSVEDPVMAAPPPHETSVSKAEVDLSIAVMPLVNMSSNRENSYFADGVHEDLMTNLTRVQGLEVVSRTTVLRTAADALTLAEIGERLNVRYVVEGSVRRIGNHVRVTVQLIDAREDRRLWASNFERELVDVFATQSELAKEISDSLHLQIQPETVGELTNMPTHSVLAYDLYYKSLSLQKTEDRIRDSMIRQIDLLEQAVEEDTDFVEACGVLKRRYDFMSNRVGSQGWLAVTPEDRAAMRQAYRAKSDRALTKAVALDRGQRGDAALSGGQSVGVIEGDRNFVSAIGYRVKTGAVSDDVLTIAFGQGDAGETVTDILFISGVNIEGLSDVGQDGLARVRQREGLVLSFAQEWPADVPTASGIK